MSVVTRCTHLKVNGARCTMPATNGKELCFEHEYRLRRMRQRPSLPSTFVTVPLVSFTYPEDHNAILENVHAIARALAHSDINERVASVMDRLMNTALRTLREGRKLEKTITCEEMIRHFRFDEDGNPRAAEPAAAESTTLELTDSACDTAQPATVPAISAVAEQPDSEPGPQPESVSTPNLKLNNLRRVTDSQNLSALLSSLAPQEKLSGLLSNTCKFRDGKLIFASERSGDSSSAHRATAYFFLMNMR